MLYLVEYLRDAFTYYCGTLSAAKPLPAGFRDTVHHDGVTKMIRGMRNTLSSNVIGHVDAFRRFQTFALTTYDVDALDRQPFCSRGTFTSSHQ